MLEFPVQLCDLSLTLKLCCNPQKLDDALGGLWLPCSQPDQSCVTLDVMFIAKTTVIRSRENAWLGAHCGFLAAIMPNVVVVMDNYEVGIVQSEYAQYALAPVVCDDPTFLFSVGISTFPIAGEDQLQCP